MPGSCFGYKLDDLLQSVQVLRADMRVSRRASETASIAGVKRGELRIGIVISILNIGQRGDESRGSPCSCET
jgi:hypothetical protein